MERTQVQAACVRFFVQWESASCRTKTFRDANLLA